jgi:hypothetical protein
MFFLNKINKQIWIFEELFFLTLFLDTLKRLCHEMNSFLKAYYDKYVLSVHALIDFTIFCFLLK